MSSLFFLLLLRSRVLNSFQTNEPRTDGGVTPVNDSVKTVCFVYVCLRLSVNGYLSVLGY